MGHKMKYVVSASVAALLCSGAAIAQDNADADDAADQRTLQTVTVTGIRSSLKRAMDVKRDNSGVVDAIAAEDLGKFPDLNVAESLQRIPGIAIDRAGGEGQSITVRGLGVVTGSACNFRVKTVQGSCLIRWDIMFARRGITWSFEGYAFNTLNGNNW